MADLVSLTGRFAGGPRLGMRRGTSAIHWYERGCALEAEGDRLGACAAYERAIAGRGDLADAHNNLGHLLHDAGELGAAEGHYRLALCIACDVALYWFNLGVVVEDQGRHAEAIAAYETAVTLEPTLADAHFNLARLFELKGRSAGDAGVLRRAVRHLVAYRDLARSGAAPAR